MTTSFGGNTTQERVVLEDKTFLITSWSVLKAAKNLPTVGKAFAVPLSFLLASMGEEQALKEAIPQAIYMLFEQLEEQDIMQLFAVILDGVMVEGRAINIDTDLKNLDELLQVAAKALMLNYGCLTSGKGFKDLLGIMVPLHQMTTQA